MKVSNNALNFLLAQYRAIFKRAYVKGLASAVLLTAGLAAGQAQAATTYNSLTSINTANGDEITINSGDTVNIEVKDNDANLNNDVVFNLGESSDFKITASGSSAGDTVAMDGNANAITINGNTAGKGTFTFGAKNADEKLQIKNLGTLTIKDNAKVIVTAGSGSAPEAGAGVDVYAETIEVINSKVDILQHVSGSAKQNAILRGKTINISGSDAVINLGSNETERSGGRATLGWRSDATLKADDSVASNNNSGSKITLSGGATLNLIGHSGVNANAYNTQGSQVWGDSLNADKSFVEVSGAGAQIWTHTNDFTDTSFHIDDKAQLVIKPFAFRVMKGGKTDGDHNFSYINGTTTFNKGNLIVEGNLQVAGTVVINDNVNLTAGNAAFNKEDSAKSNELYNGVITVGLGSDFTSEPDKAIETESILKISSTKLNEFLTESATKTEYKDAQGSDKSYDDKAGILSFGAGKVTLHFTDDSQVDLHDFNWVKTDMSKSGSGNSAVAGSIVYDTSLAGKATKDQSYKGEPVGVTVSAVDMLVSDALGSGAESINLKATNLTLGSNSYNDTTTLGFSGATAQNLKFVGDFNLADKVTLSSTRSVTQDGPDLGLVVSEDGTITGDATFVSGGLLTVELGNYTASGDFAISGGALTVQNTGAASKADSTLKLTGALDIVTNSTAAGSITVDGSGATDAATKLDLIEADVSFTASGDKSFSLKVQNGGELLAEGSDLETLLNADLGSNSGAQVVLSGGTISLEGNASIAADKLFSGSTAADGKLLFSGSGNTLEINGQLTLNGTGNVNIGTGNNLVADSLQLNNANVTSGKATLQTGDITVIDALTSSNASNTISVSGASLDLGDWADLGADATYAQALSTTGTLGANLSIDATGSVVTVKNGTWTGSSSTVTVNSGSLVVGQTMITLE